MEETFAEYGLLISQNEAPNRLSIDFEVQDKDGEIYAGVWGDEADNVEWDCKHPYQCIEFGNDIEEQGQCSLCGSYCDWHYVEEEDGSKSKEAHNWYPRRDVGGMIEEYIKGTSDGGAL